MENLTSKIKSVFSDKKKRTTIVGAGIAVATIIASTITLTNYMRERKQKKK